MGKWIAKLKKTVFIPEENIVDGSTYYHPHNVVVAWRDDHKIMYKNWSSFRTPDLSNLNNLGYLIRADLDLVEDGGYLKYNENFYSENFISVKSNVNGFLNYTNTNKITGDSVIKHSTHLQLRNSYGRWTKRPITTDSWLKQESFYSIKSDEAKNVFYFSPGCTGSGPDSPNSDKYFITYPLIKNKYVNNGMFHIDRSKNKTGYTTVAYNIGGYSVMRPTNPNPWCVACKCRGSGDISIYVNSEYNELCVIDNHSKWDTYMRSIRGRIDTGGDWHLNNIIRDYHSSSVTDLYLYNTIDINENGVIMIALRGSIAFMRIKSYDEIFGSMAKNTYKTDANSSEFIASPIIDDKTEDGRIYRGTRWRSINPQLYMEGDIDFYDKRTWCHTLPFINDNNIGIYRNGCRTGLFICRYNTDTDMIEDPGRIKLPDKARFKDTDSAINNKNEICSVSDSVIEIYQVEFVSDAAYSLQENRVSAISYNMNLTDLKIDSNFDAFSMDILLENGENCVELVVSPYKLEETSKLIPLDGRELNKNQYSYLYSLFGDKYSIRIDKDKFNLPDLSGRYIVGNKEENKFDFSNQEIQAFSLNSTHYFGFSPLLNTVKKYYKSSNDGKEINLNNDKVIDSIEVSNINTSRKSISIDDKCFMYYLKLK